MKTKTTKQPRGYIIYRGPSKLDGAPIVAVALTHSGNVKTGDMVQTYIIRDDMTPREAANTGADSSVCGTCPHRGTIDTDSGRNVGRSCYVTLFHGPRVVDVQVRAGAYPDALSSRARGSIARGRFVRLGTYGDPAAVPARVWQHLLMFSAGHTGYTHQWRNPAAAALRGLVMASADSVAEQRDAAADGWRTFRVATSAGKLPGEAVCPASAEAGHKLQCHQCLACGGADGQRRGHIVIQAHGAGKVHAVRRAAA